MWAPRYWANRFWAPRYWAPAGAAVAPFPPAGGTFPVAPRREPPKVAPRESFTVAPRKGFKVYR